MWRFAFFWCVRRECAGRERLPERGGCVLAVCHVSHLDPVAVSVLTRRPVSWLARIEFYRRRVPAWFLRRVGALALDRFGFALPGMRGALGRLSAGEIVGIFPEGEVTTGAASVLRGGRLRQGAAWLALRSGCPLVPVLVQGTDALVTVPAWLPAWRAKVRLWVGEPLRPEAFQRGGRAARRDLTAALERAFVKEWAAMRAAMKLEDGSVP